MISKTEMLPVGCDVQRSQAVRVRRLTPDSGSAFPSVLLEPFGRRNDKGNVLGVPAPVILDNICYPQNTCCFGHVKLEMVASIRARLDFGQEQPFLSAAMAAIGEKARAVLSGAQRGECSSYPPLSSLSPSSSGSRNGLAERAQQTLPHHKVRRSFGRDPVCCFHCATVL